MDSKTALCILTEAKGLFVAHCLKALVAHMKWHLTMA